VRYLIDTNVISEVAKGRGCHSAVAAWYAGVARDDLCLSVLVIGEIRGAIERLRRRDAPRAARLERWLLLIVDLFADRIVGIDRRIAERWGWLNAGERLPVIDGLIAATAIVRGMTVVTRNVPDFARAGVPILNPFEPQ